MEDFKFVLTEEEFVAQKKKYSGFYKVFNNNVINDEIKRIFDYNEMYNNARNFDSSTSFYKHYTIGKENWIINHAKRVQHEYKDQFINLTLQTVFDCIIIRMGNCYMGTLREAYIIENFQEIGGWFKVEKTNGYVDGQLKVDAIVTLEGIDSVGIQIKKDGFRDHYKEEAAHKKFREQFNMDVHYLYYIDKDTIRFNGHVVKLNEKDKIVEIFENLMVYSF